MNRFAWYMYVNTLIHTLFRPYIQYFTNSVACKSLYGSQGIYTIDCKRRYKVSHVRANVQYTAAIPIARYKQVLAL